jgi:hypothetical protein
VKVGAYLKSELIALWRSVVDPSYGRRFIEAGDGSGFEVYSQAIEQLLRVSKAVDVTTQACFISPSSQQTNPPAASAAKARVDVQFVRQLSDMSIAIVVTPDVYIDELVPDYSDDGTIEVTTSRRFLLTGPIVLGPGQPGPVTVTCESLRSGYGANNAQPGAITQLKHEGSGYSNTGASVVAGTSSHYLVADSAPDVPIPGHVGQYVELYAGSNAGQVRRIIGFVPAVYDGSSPNGGQLILAATAVWSASSLSGSFQIGEPATGPTGRAIVWYAGPQWVVFDVVDGTFGTMDQLVGDLSGAQITIETITQDPALVSETATAAWRIVGWDELGLLASNLIAPTGGRADMLGLIGWERKVFRGTGESDDLYRERVATPADTISPNAVRRAVNRVLAPIGITATLRETGLPTMRGFYADGNPNSVDPEFAFAADLDFTVRPEDRFKLAMSFLEMRAFFVIEVPDFQLGEFGMAYDDGPFNAYDLPSPYNYGADGYAWETANKLRQVWQAVEAIRGGGVGWDIVKAPAT